MADLNDFLKNTASELNYFANVEVQFTGKKFSVRPVLKAKKGDKKKMELTLKLGI